MTRQSVLWSVAALLGIVCTAAVAWSASLLAGQHIGLSGVPLSAAGQLAPAATVRAHKPSQTHPPRPVPRPAAVLPGPAASQPPPPARTVSPSPAPTAPAAPPSAGPVAPATTGSSSTSGRSHRDDGGGGGSGGASDSRQRDD
jgi:hypothetical protein